MKTSVRILTVSRTAFLELGAKQKFAAFTFTVPAGKTVTVKTTLKPITK